MDRADERQTRLALVTGAGRRVGRAIALGLAADGFDLALHYNRSREEVDSLARAVESSGRRAVVFFADLSKGDGPAILSDSVLEAFGRCDLLINNASSWPRTPIDSLSEADFDEALAVNLRSPFLLAVAIARGMRRHGCGLIVNILDWSIERPYPDFIPYGIAKAGLAAATRGLARALAPEVRVNAVAPGTVLLPEGIAPESAEAIRRAIPLGRIGEPGDIVGAIRYLLGAPYVTGTILTVDGGRSLR